MLKKKQAKSNLKKIREHFKKTSGSSDGKYFKIQGVPAGEENRKVVRVLPAWGPSAEIDGMKFPYVTARQHYGFSQGGRNTTIACPETADTYKGWSKHKFSCPVCKFSARLKSSDSKKLKKLGDRLRGNPQFYVNLIDRAEPKIVKVYGTNKKFMDNILDAEEDILDPETGRDIIIIRTGSTMKSTRYKYQIRLKQSPIGLVNWQKKMYQLDKDVIEWRTKEEIMELLMDNYPEEMIEVGMAPSKKAKPLKKKKKVREEEPEDEDEDDEDVDDEEDNEDEDDDEDAEESEEDDDDSEGEESEDEEDEDDEEDDEEEEDEDE